MKKLLLLGISLLLAPTVMAWGGFGHDIIVEIAKRNLTKRAAENIARYMPYDLVSESSWMDAHRHDEPIAYTTHWHSFRYDKHLQYDAEASSPRGDVLTALQLADENLSRYRELTDSAVVMNLRFVLHFVGDMHCPTHANPPHTPRVPVMLNGKKYKKFHTVYDAIPRLIHGSKATAQSVADALDECSKKRIKKIAAGNFIDWANEVAAKTSIIYEWNPPEVTNLHPETVEWSTDMTNELMRDAGYRTAELLNRYFDHD